MGRELVIYQVKSPFNRFEKDKSVIKYERQTLADIYNEYGRDDYDFVITINGVPIPREQWEYCVPVQNDQITLIPKPHGGGGNNGLKGIIKAIVTLIVVIVVTVLTSGTGTAESIGLMLGAEGTMAFVAGATVLGSLAGMAVGLVWSALAPRADVPDSPLLGSSMGDGAVTQTYSWNSQTTQAQGGVIPRIYGTIKNKGNIISTYVESNIGTTNQYLDVLLLICSGRISRIYDIYLNDQPVSNYSGVTIETRTGRINQPAIPLFNFTRIEFQESVKVTYGSPKIKTTINNNFDGLEVEVQFPRGLFYANDQGTYSAYSVSFTVQIRKVVTGQGAEDGWITINNNVVTTPAVSGSSHWSLGFWLYGGCMLQAGSYTSISGGWVEFENGGTDVEAHYEGQREFYAGQQAHWRWTGSYYTTYQNYSVATGASGDPVRFTFKSLAPAQDKGYWQTRVTRNTADPAARYIGELYLVSIREIYVDDCEYPRNALVGVRALATDQLSGSFNFSCMVDGAIVRKWDGSVWSLVFTDNPAWICYDVLSQPVLYDNWVPNVAFALNDIVIPSTLCNRLFKCVTAGTSGSTEPSWDTTIGNNTMDNTVAWQCIAGATVDGVVRFEGINDDRLDKTKFKEWADYCDELVPDGKGGTEKRCTFNGTFDSGLNMWECALQVCQVARAALVWNGTTITIMIDKPTEPTWLVSVGNIGIDSFKEVFLPLEDRASELECTFINKEINYEQDKFSVVNSNINTKPVKTNFDMRGVVKPSEIWRLANYHLNYNRYLLRTVQLAMDIDALACTVGDVILVQHDVPQWGFGGRVVSATSTSVTLDSEVTIGEGTYEILFRLYDDSVVTKAVTNAPGVYTVIDISVPFTTVPHQYDIWALGPTNTSSKPFRVIGVRKAGDQRCELTLLEYIEEIYATDYDFPDISAYNYSLLTLDIPPVTNVALTERLYYRLDGVMVSAVDISCSFPDYIGFAGVDVWYRYGNEPWQYSGRTYERKYSILNVRDGENITVKLVSFAASGSQQNFGSAPEVTIPVLGKIAPPSDVTEFWAQPAGNGIRLDWTPITDIDVANYEIRWNPILTEDATWQNSITCAVVGREATSKTFPAMISGKYLIKAIDTTGHYSQNACELDMTVPEVLQYEEVFHREEDPSWSGTFTDTYIDYAGRLTLLAADVFDDILDIDGLYNWDYLTGGGILGGIETVGYYELATPITLGALLTCRLSCLPDWLSVDFATSFDYWPDIDSLTAWDGDESVGTQVTPQLNLSLNGTDYLGWQDFIMGDFTFYSVKLRLKLSTIYPAAPCRAPFVSHLDFYAYAPQRRLYGNDLAVGTGGESITYSMQFFNKPVVGITIQSAQSGDYPYITAQSETGFTIAIKNGGTNVARTIDWQAAGF